MARRPLSGEDRDLWMRVARTATPLHPKTTGRLEDEAALRPAAKPTMVQPTRAISTPFTPRSFRVGQTASTPTVLPVPTTPAQRLAAQPLHMDQKTHRRMVQGKLRPQERLDLHGMTLDQAQGALFDFILRCRQRGLRLVLVITGKGRGDYGPLPYRSGALRHHVPVWLRQGPMALAVQQITPAHLRHGGEGAYYVYLRRAG